MVANQAGSRGPAARSPYWEGRSAPGGGRLHEVREGRVWLRALLGVVGVVVSAALLSTVFFRWSFAGGALSLTQRFPLRRFWAELPSQLPWLLPFIACSAAIIPLRALQWQEALPRKVPFRERYHLVAISAFANNTIPGKLGEVVRAFLLSRTQRIPFLSAVGSIAVCKILETAALVLLVAASFVGPFGGITRRFAGPLWIGIAAVLALMLLVIVVAQHAPRMAAALHRRNHMHRTQELLASIGEGLGAARSVRGMAVLFVLSIGPVVAPALGYGLGLRALGIPGGLLGGSVVLGAIALGQTAVGVPAGLGIYYFVTSWVARSLGASPEQAAAYAFLTHLGTIAAQVGLGGISVWRRGIRLRDLRRRTGQAKEELRHVPEEADAVLERQPV